MHPPIGIPDTARCGGGGTARNHRRAAYVTGPQAAGRRAGNQLGPWAVILRRHAEPDSGWFERNGAPSNEPRGGAPRSALPHGFGGIHGTQQMARAPGFRPNTAGNAENQRQAKDARGTRSAGVRRAPAYGST